MFENRNQLENIEKHYSVYWEENQRNYTIQQYAILGKMSFGLISMKRLRPC